MKDRQEYLKYLLARKTLTSEEKEWLLNYLEGRDISDVEKVASEDFESDLMNGRQSLDSVRSESLLENIHTRIEIPQRSFARLVRLNPVKIAVAATIILLAGAGYWFKETKSATIPVQQQQVVTTGKRKKIQLADGSLITLEPNSRLSYPGKFTGYTRDVALTGEAYFEVEHKPEHPFVVHSPYVNVTVLGTSFNVEAYENGITKVVVSTGSVKVQTTDTKEQQAVIINSNQSVVYNNKTSEIEKKEAQDDALYYKERHLGRFTYNGVAIAKVIAEMERYYHIQVTLPQNMGNCVFYGYFQSDDSIEKALSLVALAMNATVQKNSNGTGYSIVGGNCR